MSHHAEYQQWPFLTQEEFDLACAFFDQKYVRAKLGPTRQIFKIRPRRSATTGATFIEILRLLQLPQHEDDLSLALERLNRGPNFSHCPPVSEMEMDTTHEDADEVSFCNMYHSVN